MKKKGAAKECNEQCTLATQEANAKPVFMQNIFLRTCH
jgi:hypothetical protein